MLQQIWDGIVWLIGGGEDYSQLTVVQVISRTIIIYLIALVIIRVGKRRFMGNYSSFDILLGFILGSIMARGITGGMSFPDMVLVVAVLMALHWVIATVSFYWKGFNEVLENEPRKLVIDGELQEDAMRASKIRENDLRQAMREKGKVESEKEVKSAYLENDGTITVIPKKNEPKVLEVKVEEGVQTVRIVLSD
jgi:uncharacterized membrane protein YcaP (DUF421 family)